MTRGVVGAALMLAALTVQAPSALARVEVPPAAPPGSVIDQVRQQVPYMTCNQCWIVRDIGSGYSWFDQYAFAYANDPSGIPFYVRLDPEGGYDTANDPNKLFKYQWTGDVAPACGYGYYDNAHDQGTDTSAQGAGASGVFPTSTSAHWYHVGMAYSSSCKQNWPYAIQVDMNAPNQQITARDPNCTVTTPVCTYVTSTGNGNAAVTVQFWWCGDSNLNTCASESPTQPESVWDGATTMVGGQSQIGTEVVVG
jgi:hypothetical protein